VGRYCRLHCDVELSGAHPIGIHARELQAIAPHPLHPINTIYFPLTMDVEMGDVGYDIDIDVGASLNTTSAPPPPPPPQQQQQDVSSAWRVAVAVSRL
jgi:hypothetical protein